MKDYYKILGLSKGCSLEEIDKAYRNLASKYHPDKNPDNEIEFSKKFKEIQEAYEKLKSMPLFSFKFENNSVDDIFDNMLNKFFGNQKANNYSKIRVRVSLDEVYNGCEKIIEYNESSYCETCRGTGGESWAKCDICKGVGYVDHSICHICKGKGSVVIKECNECKGNGLVIKDRKKININIPPGIQDETQIRIAGEHGDLFVIVNVQKNSKFTREGLDLKCILEVPYDILILGGICKLDLFNKQIDVKIKPRTKTGSKIVFKEVGMPSLKDPNARGDLQMEVQLKMPEKISKDYKKLLEKLKTIES
jgi:molecular chaperone DnaJ